MSKVKSRADFEKDNALKTQYGSYDKYLNASSVEQQATTPTLNDYVSVAETGGLPKEQPKSPYDTYMEEAKRFYNQGVTNIPCG